MAKSKKDRMPNQPDGMPQGKHMTGFKGMKTDGACFCGACHPNAGKKFVRVIDKGKSKLILV